MRIFDESELGSASELGPYMSVLPKRHPHLLWTFSASEIAEFQVRISARGCTALGDFALAVPLDRG